MINCKTCQTFVSSCLPNLCFFLILLLVGGGAAATLPPAGCFIELNVCGSLLPCPNVIQIPVFGKGSTKIYKKPQSRYNAFCHIFEPSSLAAQTALLLLEPLCLGTRIVQDLWSSEWRSWWFKPFQIWQCAVWYIVINISHDFAASIIRI
jgi:hypothetical protein